MLIIENISGISVDINDLGLSLSPAESIDLTLEADARDVAASAAVNGNLNDLIASGNIVVKDPSNITDNLSTTQGIDAVRAHNNTHYRMPLGARIADAIDVDLTADGPYLMFNGTSFVRQTPAQIATSIESSIDITNIPDFDSGATPGGSDSNIQYNNNGSFGGSDVFNFNDQLNRVDINGADAMPQLTIGGTTRIDSGETDATLYIQLDTDSPTDALQIYFNRTAPLINGWITFNYDGFKPTICLVDEDDDSPDIKFQVIGNGTEADPQFNNTFGGFGQSGDAKEGFEWKEREVTVAKLETGVFDVIGPAAEYRVNGIPLMRPTFMMFAEENADISVGVNNYEYSFGNGAVNVDATPSGIPVGVRCTLIAITASANQASVVATTFSISVTRNGTIVATSGIASSNVINEECKVTSQVTPDTVIFEVGDTIQFLTASKTGSLRDVRVSAWFERIE